MYHQSVACVEHTHSEAYSDLEPLQQIVGLFAVVCMLARTSQCLSHAAFDVGTVINFQLLPARQTLQAGRQTGRQAVHGMGAAKLAWGAHCSV